MMTLLSQGGPIMYLLLACSVMGTFIVIQKLLFLQSNKLEGRHVLESIKNHLQTEGKSKTTTLLLREKKVMAKVLATVIEQSQAPGQDANQAVAHASHLELGKLDRFMGTLSSIITVAPILGLMGTVLGLMDVFNVISGGGIGDPELLSGGIAKALVTTVAGLGLSVPFIFCYAMLNRLIEQFIGRTEQYANELLQFCQRQGGLLP